MALYWIICVRLTIDGEILGFGVYLGADKVRAVMMASRYIADISWIDARELAKTSVSNMMRFRLVVL